ncbi:MAG TPA: hypothetical protein VNN24_09095 [Candidatus Binatus sp.]|nr:hypothetical protein [Candidatus Binatus sp.]
MVNKFGVHVGVGEVCAASVPAERKTAIASPLEAQRHSKPRLPRSSFLGSPAIARSLPAACTYVRIDRHSRVGGVPKALTAAGPAVHRQDAFATQPCEV